MCACVFIVSIDTVPVRVYDAIGNTRFVNIPSGHNLHGHTLPPYMHLHREML
jgi:hypothetical protein